MILGLNGDPGSGKDSIGIYLVERYGFTRLAFADRLRELTGKANPIVGWRATTGQCSCRCHGGWNIKHVAACCHPTPGGPVHWNDAIERYGSYDAAKVHYPEMRRFQRYFGTEVVRDEIDQDYWVRYVTDQFHPLGNYVVTDMRFWNEATGIRDVGGKTVHVHRPGLSEATDHRSDIELADWSFDAHITNDGTLDDLYRKSEYLFKIFA